MSRPIEKITAFRAKNGTIHASEYDARVENFKSLYKEILILIANSDGSEPNPRATLYRLGVELPNDKFEEFVEAARTIRASAGVTVTYE